MIAKDEFTADGTRLFNPSKPHVYATSTTGGATSSINITAGAAGVRINGSLVVVTTGTPGQWNVLWD